jgi:Na+-driven multidrug efflux pump
MLLIALIPVFGLGNAAGTLVGQGLGARKPGRAEASAWWVSAYAAGLMVVAAVLLFVFARPLMAMFDATPQVVTMGVDCLRIVGPTLVVNAVGVVLARSFDGAGNTVPAMVVNLLSLWALEVPAAYLLSRTLGVTGVWWGRGVANLANGLFFGLWFLRGRWKEREV